MAAAAATAAAGSSDEACKDDDALSSTLRSCGNDPDFAVICAFLQKFGKSLGLDLPSFKHFQEWLTNNDDVSASLRDLHIKLLRKTRKTVHEKNWETAISKFCFSYSLQDAWEIERFGYKNSSLKVKLRLFRELLECQFERNAKFRAHLLTLSADSLRAQPIGRDRLGHSYWLTQDEDCNLRIYQEHLDEEIWQVVATNRDEFVQLIARLRGNEVVLPSKDIGEADEDTSSSNSCNAPVEKPPPPEEKEDDSQEEEAKVPNLKIKLNTSHSSLTIVDNDDEESGKSKKVKPLLITQSKLASISPASNKKRTIEDVEKYSPSSDDLQTQKKPRPTLLDAKRIKKPSRYETPKSEDDNEQDDSDLDGEEEEDMDDEDDGGSEELDGEEEDIDSAAAEEDENEEKEDIEDYDDDEDDDEVGEAIEDPPVIVRGQGSGRDCNAARPNFEYMTQDEFLLNDYSDDENVIVGDTIEEPIIIFTGFGSGEDCLVGNKTEPNTGESNEPKATFFFGEPGCLKLSPMKQTPKPETKRSIFDSVSNHGEMKPEEEKNDYDNEKPIENLEKLAPEKTNGESVKIEETCTNDKTETEPQNDESKNKTKNTSEDTTNQECEKQQNNVDEKSAVCENESEKLSENLDKKNSQDEIQLTIANETNDKTVSPKPELKSTAELPEAINTVEDISKKVESDKDKEIIEEKHNTSKITEIEDERPSISMNVKTVEPIKFDLPKKDECKTVETLPTSKVDTTTSSSKVLTENGTVEVENEINSKNIETSNSSELSKNTEISNKSKNNETEIEINHSDKKDETSQSEKKADVKLEINKTNEVPTSKIESPSSNPITPTCSSLSPSSSSSSRSMLTSISTSQPSTSGTLPNRKRRLTDFAVAPQSQPNIRHSTSESEIDLHSEKQDELNEEEDDLDIGGKRIKMRPKLTNVELRRKVEAQKTQIEEATSSSGEEDARSRRKIIAPKRKFERTPEKSSVEVRQEKLLLEKSLNDEAKSVKGTSAKSAERDEGDKKSISEYAVINAAPKKTTEEKPTKEQSPSKEVKDEQGPAKKYLSEKTREKSTLNEMVAVKQTEKNMLKEEIKDVKPIQKRRASEEQSMGKTNQDKPIAEPSIRNQTQEKTVEENRTEKLMANELLSGKSKLDKISPEKAIPQNPSSEKSIPQAALADSDKLGIRAEEKPVHENLQLLPLNTKNQVPDKPVFGSLLAPSRLAPEKSTPDRTTSYKPLVHEKPTPTIKHKPTLAEIIEKKLKKTTIEKPQDFKPTEFSNSRTAVSKPPYNKPLEPTTLESPVAKPSEQKPSESSLVKAPVLKQLEIRQAESTKLKPAVLKIPEVRNIFKSHDVKSLDTKSVELQTATELKIPEFKPTMLKSTELKSGVEKITVAPMTTQKSSHSLEASISKLYEAAAAIKEKPREVTPPPTTHAIVAVTTPPDSAQKMFSSPADTQPTTIFTPPKKSPITKPLKKNLLTQIRQEESDEEAIPRKRTISENLTSKTSTSSGVESAARPAELIQPTDNWTEVSHDVAKEVAHRTPDRQTPERQRKRRSSEEAKTVETLQASGTDEEGVSEKIKRNEEDVVKDKEKETKTNEPAKFVDEPKVEKESTPEPIQVTGRRSGRRGGTAVVYTELPQPKRTRGGAKATNVEKTETIKVEKEIETDQTPPVAENATKKSITKKSNNTKDSPHTKPKEEKKTVANMKTESPKEEVKIEKELLEVKTEEESEKPLEKTADTDPVKPSTELESDDIKPPPAITPRGRGSRKKREVDATNIIETNDDTPVRQSRRIAQQKIKEEAERRKMEEIALRSMKQELKKKKKAEKETDPTVIDPSGESSSESEVELKKKAKKKCPGKDGWSSGSEEQEDTEEEVEEPPHYSDHGSPLFRSDHEFSPESDLEDESQVVPMKRARTARKENAEDGEEDDADEACQKCGKSDHPEWILLCDSCDKGYHCSCLSPVLFYIPEGDWYCPPCQQDQLIKALEQQLKQFDELVARKETEKLLAEQAEREEKERLEAEKREEEERRAAKKEKKKNKRRNDSGSDGSKNSDDDGTDDSDKGSKDTDDDSDDDRRSKTSKSTSKRIKHVEKSEKRRRGDGRSNRRAAKRGTRRRRRGDSDSGSDSKSGSGSGSDSGSRTSSSSFSDSDDEPIYKLRKRRQINVSYRLNEYDDLINSALKKEMDEVAGAGNLGRGKDITTIIEADKEEKARQRQIDDGEEDEAEQERNEQAKIEKTKTAKSNRTSDNDDDDDDDDDVPLKIKSKPKSSLKKKARKLTTLDISSEEDHGSDEDFKTSSFEDDEEDTSISASESDSDSSLEVYRRRGKSGGRGKHQRKAARRAARERRKDRKFVVDESDESEEEARPKSKKKRKGDSDYSESESDGDEDVSEISENVDSADLCDDTTSESSDGAWHPSKRKKQRKSNPTTIARKSPKLKKPLVKKPKRIEYSDDDISETEPEDDDEEDDGITGSGKGSGKQPRSQPLKPTLQPTKPKTKSPAIAKKKKKPPTSDEQSGSDDSTRRTRGRRYAYLEDFDDDSSDGGIKPGVKRPDTPPEERQKFIQKQEEIKRMLAEKNAEGAKLAATPRLTPIKGTNVPPTVDKRTPTKASDSLSTVPLSVIRQAKVLDIDYLQRKGENVGDLENVDDVESEFDDADFPDDLPDDMDEDAIARMVEEEEFSAAAAARELPAPDEVLRTTNKSKSKPTEPANATESSIKPVPIAAAAAATPPPVPAPTPQPVTSNASGLQEPMRKRLPMPTMHPPLLRHQFPPHHGMPPHHLMQRHPGPPPMQLLQNALSAPLGQPLNRNAFSPHPAQQALPPHLQRLPLGMPPGAHGHGLPPAHIMQAAFGRVPPNSMGGAPPSAQLAPSREPPQPPASLIAAEAPESKPRGRRKKITPLRDSLQKQQAAAAVTAATTTSGDGKPLEPGASIKTTAPSSSNSGVTLTVAQPPQLYKPHSAPDNAQPSVITRMPHLPPHPARPPPHTGRPPPPGAAMYANAEALHARFYGQPLPTSTNAGGGTRSPVTQQQQQLHSPSGTNAGAPNQQTPPPQPPRPQLPPGMPPHSALRPTYGPPPPLRGSLPPTNVPPGSTGHPGSRSPYLHGDHHGPTSLAGVYAGGPPPARHSTVHLNPYRPTIYGNPNFPPRVAPPGAQNLRAGASPHAVDYAAGPRGYPPYGYYPPPPPLTTPAHSQPPHTPTTGPVTNTVTSAPSSVIVSARPASAAPAPAPPTASAPTSLVVVPTPSTTVTPTNHSVTALTRHTSTKTPPPSSSAAAVPPPAPIAAIAKSVITEPRKKLTTLEAYSATITKSPLTVAGESSGSPAGLQSTDAAEDSSSAPGSSATAAATAAAEGASEFSGLVSYFSSQHDDYNT